MNEIRINIGEPFCHVFHNRIRYVYRLCKVQISKRTGVSEICDRKSECTLFELIIESNLLKSVNEDVEPI